MLSSSVMPWHDDERRGGELMAFKNSATTGGVPFFFKSDCPSDEQTSEEVPFLISTINP